MVKKRLVVGNWKMYIDSPEEAKRFASALRKKSRLYKGVEVVLAPSFPLVPIVADKLKGSAIKVGAQAVSVYEDAPHTGDVSAHMLKNVGATYAIVGHSERRALRYDSGQAAGETEEVVHAQLERALGAGFVAVLCVGERERDAGGAYYSVVAGQLTSALAGLAKPGKLVVAYEPVWAIGKSAADAMKPAELREMSIFIKKTLSERFDRAAAMRVPILYGGSVEPANASALIAEGDVNGFLVGHASADVAPFVEIVKSVRPTRQAQGK